MLVVNQIPSRVTQLDLTANKIYTLGEQSEQIAAGLTDDVAIYVVAQTGNEDDTLSALLDQYEGASDHITVETIDPVVSPNFLSQYTSDSVYENSVVVVCGERSRYIGYYDIFETDYSSYYTSGTTSTDFNGESEITSALDYVTSDDLPVAYQLQGHGEQGLGSSAEDAIAGENIDLEDLSLLTEDGVPDDCECLIIASPQTDITSDEKDAIQAYLEGGGTMLLVTDYTEDALPNLAELMESYGVTKTDGIVVEGDGNYSLRGYSHYLLPDIDYHTITSPLQDGSYYVLMPVAQGLIVSDDLRDSLDVTELLTTSDDAYSKVAGYEMTTYERNPAISTARSPTRPIGRSWTAARRRRLLTTSMMFDDDVDTMSLRANTDLRSNRSLDVRAVKRHHHPRQIAQNARTARCFERRRGALERHPHRLLPLAQIFRATSRGRRKRNDKSGFESESDCAPDARARRGGGRTRNAAGNF